MIEWFRVFLSRFIGLFRNTHLDSELETELNFHLDMQIQDNMKKGMSRKEAQNAALRDFGGFDQTKEKYRDGCSLRFVEDFFQDIRYSLRLLVRNTGFSLAAVLTLALGIGVNTAVFSVVNAVLLRPLPFDQPEELVQLKSDSPMIGITSSFYGESAFLTFRQGTQTLSEIAAYAIEQSNMSGREGADRVLTGKASASFFPLLGVSPSIGRNFLEEEDRPGGEPVVIISDSLWKKRFGGDPSVLGRSVILDGLSYSVIGILPTSFDYPGIPAHIDLWIPLLRHEINIYSQSDPMSLIGRLRPSSQIQTALAELDGIYQSLRLTKAMNSRLLLVNLQEEITKNTRLPLLLFLGAVSLVLLIACCNVANLMLARAATREREMAIRTIMGAQRIRILRQLLTESLVITLLGASLGLTLAFWSRGALQALLSESLVNVTVIPMDLWVLGFTLLIAVGTTLAVGIVPVLQTCRLNIFGSLRDGRYKSMGPRLHLTNKLFIVVEVGLVVVLLIGAGLLFRSLHFVQQIDPGFRPERILSMSIDLTPSKYPTVQAQSAYFEQVLERLKKLPGVESIAANAALPFSGLSFGSSGSHPIEGRTETVPDDEIPHPISVSSVSSDYFRTMGIPLLLGRTFEDIDREGTPNVKIVDKAFVRRYFPDQNPIGQIILTSGGGTIVGVVGEVRQFTLDQEEIHPHVYTPYLQQSSPMPRMGIAVRSEKDPMDLTGPIRDVFESIDSDQPVFDMMTLEDRLSDSLGRRKINSLLVGTLALLALLLAFIGIYGVLSYTVSQRTHEIGIRMALGARERGVLWMIVSQAMGICIIGLLFGIGGALATTRLISSLLYGVQTTDAVTFAAASIFVISVALIASYIPARRATTVDPMKSLRYE